MKELTVAERFAKDTKDHKLTVLHNDGLYRHLRFAKGPSNVYRFDLVTWPGHLAIAGDMGKYVFARLPDMFEFFRAPEVNVDYWMKKLVAPRREHCLEFSEERARELVDDISAELDEHGEISKHIEAQLGTLTSASTYEEFMAAAECMEDEDGCALLPDAHEFHGRVMAPTFHVLWCLHAIRWGIEVFDALPTVRPT